MPKGVRAKIDREPPWSAVVSEPSANMASTQNTSVFTEAARMGLFASDTNCDPMSAEVSPAAPTQEESAPAPKPRKLKNKKTKTTMSWDEFKERTEAEEAARRREAQRKAARAAPKRNKGGKPPAKRVVKRVVRKVGGEPAAPKPVPVFKMEAQAFPNALGAAGKVPVAELGAWGQGVSKAVLDDDFVDPAIIARQERRRRAALRAAREAQLAELEGYNDLDLDEIFDEETYEEDPNAEVVLVKHQGAIVRQLEEEPAPEPSPARDAEWEEYQAFLAAERKRETEEVCEDWEQEYDAEDAAEVNWWDNN